MVRPARGRTFRSRAGSRLGARAARRTRPRRGRTDPSGPAAHQPAVPARRMARLPAAHRRSTSAATGTDGRPAGRGSSGGVAALARTGRRELARPRARAQPRRPALAGGAACAARAPDGARGAATARGALKARRRRKRAVRPEAVRVLKTLQPGTRRFVAQYGKSLGLPKSCKHPL